VPRFSLLGVPWITDISLAHEPLIKACVHRVQNRWQPYHYLLSVKLSLCFDHFPPHRTQHGYRYVPSCFYLSTSRHSSLCVEQTTCEISSQRNRSRIDSQLTHFEFQTEALPGFRIADCGFESLPPRSTQRLVTSTRQSRSKGLKQENIYHEIDATKQTCSAFLE